MNLRSFLHAVVTLLSIITICNFQIQRKTWPAHYSDAHRQLHEDVRQNTRSHLQDFEIVVPFATDEHYRLLTYSVRHRFRRDTHDQATPLEMEELRFSVSGFGQNFQLRLLPNHRLLAPSFYVKVKKNQTEEELEESETLTCHYEGWLTSHHGGTVRMSTCGGLKGLMKTEEDDFLIEPVSSYLNHSFESSMEPHLIYKRRHLVRGNHHLHYCGTKRSHPVFIPKSVDPKTLNLLSNGEIELEEVDEEVKRLRRSISANENDRELIETVNRSRPEHKTVETLVVADHHLMMKHARDPYDVTAYILTVMNVVSGLFSDHTLDGRVDIVLVGLILLENNDGLELDHKADVSLANFCKWQNNLNHSNGKAPDHSILLTGLDICVHKNSPCETLGLAQIGGMCSRRHSCTINEDMGLGIAYTVAHETGHSFGMKHDGLSNECSKRKGHIMSPTLDSFDGMFTWSSCSRGMLNDFLSGVNSMCLDDYPSAMPSYRRVSQLPGQMYGTDLQCQWQFGFGAHVCPYRYLHTQASLCKILWCQKEGWGICKTKYLPAAEGSVCGSKMWCRRGVCVSLDSSGPQPIDGSWSDFGEWSSCTRSCGGGVQFQQRTCTKPSPKYGGRPCSGKNKLHRLCNTEKCLSSQIDFRAQQCAAFNMKLYRRKYFTWTPFNKYSRFGSDSCKLLCKANGYGFFDLLSDKVLDGTRCDESSFDVCIDGTCRQVGCDLVLGSNATLDDCGICNGNNTSCIKITGRFEKSINQSGYYEVVRIPRGARNVEIREESCCTHSYIAVKKGTAPFTYYLNGNWKITLQASKTMAGVKWTYHRKAFHQEYLSSGILPLQEDILVEVLVIAKNPGIMYSYIVPKVFENLTLADIDLPSTHEQRANFSWSVVNGQCSASCAGGLQTSTARCMKNNQIVVDDENCKRGGKPPGSTTKCNTDSCPARWVVSDWKECSQTCGKGMRDRHVTCKIMTSLGDLNTLDEDCNLIPKPAVTKKCRRLLCPPEWSVGSWTECSRRCGKGKRTRRVYCRRGTRKVRQSACNRSHKPKRKERCGGKCQKKYQWRVTAWGPCTASCGGGNQRRLIKCSYKQSSGKFRIASSRKCEQKRKPNVSLKKRCNSGACLLIINETNPNIYERNLITGLNFQSDDAPPAKWVVGSWQKCTVGCGGGFQLRAVKCWRFDELLSATACADKRRPIAKRACNTHQCILLASNEQDKETNDIHCFDKFPWCSLVAKHKQCLSSLFGSHCCKSCSGAL